MSVEKEPPVFESYLQRVTGLDQLLKTDFVRNELHVGSRGVHLNWCTAGSLFDQHVSSVEIMAKRVIQHGRSRRE